MIRKWILLLVISSGMYHHGIAQSPATTHPPKIGLAFSGGGAKGFAEVGVLQVMEDVGLKADCVTGVSMGSIAGALYAIGYSADSVAYIVEHMDWSALLSNQIPYRDVALEEKDQYDKFIAEFPFQHGAPALPSGLIHGELISLALAKYTMPVAGITDFKKFPVPFMCMASDLTTGYVYRMSEGHVAEALRASMAIPSIFTPVWYNKHYLVDGGVLHNFPVSELKEMGADIIIGINVGGNLSPADQLTTLSEILVQTVFLGEEKNDSLESTLCNILITPDLKGYTTADFYAADSIVALGRIAGEQYRPVFQRLKDSLEQIYPGMFDRRIQLPAPKPIIIRKIEVEGVDTFEAKYVRKKVDIPLNKPITEKEIRNGIVTLYGTLGYYKVIYELIADGDAFILKLIIHSAPPAMIGGALNYNTYFGGALILNFSLRNILLSGSRFVATLNAGDKWRAKANYNLYFGADRQWRAGAFFNFNQYDAPLYVRDVNNESRVTSLHEFNTWDVSLQGERILSGSASAGFGFHFDHFGFNEKITADTILKNVKATDFRPSLFLKVNSLNNAYYASRGTEINAYLEFPFDYDQKIILNESDPAITDSIEAFAQNIMDETSKSFFQFTLTVRRHSKLSEKFTLINSFYGGFSGDKEHVINHNYVLGGVEENFRHNIPFVGLKEFEANYHATEISNVAVYKLALQYEIVKKVFLLPKVNIGNTGISFSDFTSRLGDANTYLLGAGLTMAYNSILGPLEITFMTSNQYSNNYIVYFNLGFNFY